MGRTKGTDAAEVVDVALTRILNGGYPAVDLEVETVTTSDRRLVTRLVETLDGAASALLCVAFVKEGGLRLLEDPLRNLGPNGRLLVTTVFERERTHQAIGIASADFRLEVRVLNPGAASTFHPKVFLSKKPRHHEMVIGSANLTNGIVCNHEAGIWVRGRAEDPPLVDAWTWAEELWDRGTEWPVGGAERNDSAEEFDIDLFRALNAAVRQDATFLTISEAKRNIVHAVTRTHVMVESESRTGPQPIPAWMLNIAWRYLETHGSLTNATLLADPPSGLNVKRSSAVCAILARLPGIEVATRRPILLRRIR